MYEYYNLFVSDKHIHLIHHASILKINIQLKIIACINMQYSIISKHAEQHGCLS